MVVQPIVEGQGDEAAAPVLLRRLAAEAGAWNVRIAKPHRRRRNQLARKADLQSAVQVAMLTADCAGIFVLCDADDDCPRERAPALEAWAREAAGHVPCAVVMANREYEAWFLASIDSLRGRKGVRADAAAHPEPEAPRDAKREMKERMRHRRYLETVHQEQLTAIFDLSAAHRRCRGFRKLVSAFGSLLDRRGERPAPWPPAAWTAR